MISTAKRKGARNGGRLATEPLGKFTIDKSNAGEILKRISNGSSGNAMPAQSDLIVARVDKARQLLAEAKDAPSAKRVVDMAHAAEIFAKRQKLSEDCIRDAHAIKIEAMRMMGEHLQRSEKNKGTAGPGRGHKNKKAPSPYGAQGAILL